MHKRQRQDLADIQRGMSRVVAETEAGTFGRSLHLEDVHLNIEKRLTTLVGDAGKRLHTGRSRNDQVATDIRLYLRDAIDDILALLDPVSYTHLDVYKRQGQRALLAASGVIDASRHQGIHSSMPIWLALPGKTTER